MTQKRKPRILVFLGAFGKAQHFTVTITGHADCHENRHVLDLTGSTSLQERPVQLHVRMAARPTLDRPVTPLIDVPVRFLVQRADC